MNSDIKKDPGINQAASRWGELNQQLDALTGKTDTASVELYDTLIEELMCVDMSLKPIKDAMKNATEWKPNEK